LCKIEKKSSSSPYIHIISNSIKDSQKKGRKAKSKNENEEPPTFVELEGKNRREKRTNENTTPSQTATRMAQGSREYCYNVDAKGAKQLSSW
jgi:hypothetical protein